jgi:hypothetical protein
VATAFTRVLNLLAAPTTLLAPGIVVRVLWNRPVPALPSSVRVDAEIPEEAAS